MNLDNRAARDDEKHLKAKLASIEKDHNIWLQHNMEGMSSEEQNRAWKEIQALRKQYGYNPGMDMI